MQRKTIIYSIFILILLMVKSTILLYSQETTTTETEKDSLVRLIEASSARLLEIEGVQYRKVIGPARFLHNNTYLLCDSALWNVNKNIIDALGNVEVLQESTTLRSDRIEYLVDSSLARVRGNLVELLDNEDNVLRTRFLDYYTKDSSGTFFNGGVMVNQDGNLIESIDGNYDSKAKLFTFINDVNMFADSTFILSDKIIYNTISKLAYFGENTVVWQQKNTITANSGIFDRDSSIIIFNKDPYIITPEQELLSDSLIYLQNKGRAELYWNVQMLDTVQSVYVLSDKAIYESDPLYVELTEEPVIISVGVQDGIEQNSYTTADTIKYYSLVYKNVDSLYKVNSEARLKIVTSNPIGDVEKKNMEAKQAAEERKRALLGPPQLNKDKEEPKEKPKSREEIQKDSIAAVLAAVEDSLAQIVLDNTNITFVEAYKNVKFMRGAMQGLCDSLAYSSLDSLARLYYDPVIWNEVTNQYTADSIFISIKNEALSKANLLSNAFIVSQQDSVYYNQIKGPEMIAYFNEDSELYKFDAFGGVTALFYLKKDSIITEVNQKGSKMLSALLKNGEMQKIKYFEEIKNDAFPVWEVNTVDHRLRDFAWRGEERPISRYEITDREIVSSNRIQVEAIKYPNYPLANRFFPTERDSILIYLAYMDSVKHAIPVEVEEDTIVGVDTLMRDTTVAVAKDTTSKIKLNDTIKRTSDTSREGKINSLTAKIDELSVKIKDKSIERKERKKLRKERRVKKRELRHEKRLLKKELKEEKKRQKKR